VLDESSRKIMSILLKDGRSTNNTIANKLGLSVSSVTKKINMMLKNGIISIIATANPVKMGNHASALIGLNIDAKQVDNICTELKTIPNVHIMVSTFGRFDLFLITFFRDWSELQTFTKTTLEQIPGINAVSTYLVSEMKMDYPVSFQNTIKEDDKTVLDSMDWQIISELMKNGRPKYSELVKKLGTSKSTISRRISLLLNKNVINIVAIPNIRLDYLADAFVLIDADYSKIDEICKTLINYPQTHFIMTLVNGPEILISIQSINRDELYKFITYEVSKLEGVLRCETFLVTNFLHFSAAALYKNTNLSKVVLDNNVFQMKDVNLSYLK